MASDRPPPEFIADGDYTRWKRKVHNWQRVTNLEKSKQGNALLLALEKNKEAEDAVWDLDQEVIDGEDGVNSIIKLLDRLYIKDKTQLTSEGESLTPHTTHLATRATNLPPPQPSQQQLPPPQPPPPQPPPIQPLHTNDSSLSTQIPPKNSIFQEELDKMDSVQVASTEDFEDDNSVKVFNKNENYTREDGKSCITDQNNSEDEDEFEDAGEYMNEDEPKSVKDDVIKDCHQVQDVEEHKAKFEKITTSFLYWITTKITDLNVHNFPTSSEAVKKLLHSHNQYMTEEKSAKQKERDEILQLLPCINAKLSALNQPKYIPNKGHQIQDIEKKWGELEKAENLREVALKELQRKPAQPPLRNLERAPKPSKSAKQPKSQTSSGQLVLSQDCVEFQKNKLKHVPRLPDGTPIKVKGESTKSTYNTGNKSLEEYVQRKDVEKLKVKYENIVTSFLAWIKAKITDLEVNKFPISSEAVKKLIDNHKEYTTMEKNAKQKEKDEMEQLLAVINEKLSNLNQPQYTPDEGHQMQKIKQKWKQLEEAEKSREVVLKNLLDINDSLTITTDANIVTEDASRGIRYNSKLNKQIINYKEILKTLSLEEVMTYQFDMKDILTISRISLKGEEPQTIKEKFIHIISKIIGLDYRSRYIEMRITENQFFEKSISAEHNNEEKKLEIPENDLDSDTDDIDELDKMIRETNEESQQKKSTVLHPSDIIVILMNCCDSILRQMILQKMFICKLAVPLVLPNIKTSEPEFLLWATRLMNMTWKTQSNGSKEVNPVDYPSQIVSAVKLGDISKSKSNILNNVLCNQPHDIFFHRDCKWGNSKRMISNGMIELAWYLPGGKKEDNFYDMITLANLRGDAKFHSLEFKLLNMASSLLLVFLSLQSISDPGCSLMLKHLSTSKQHLVFIFLSPVNNFSEIEEKQIIKDFKKIMGEKKYKTVVGSLRGQEKNADDLTNEIRKKINISLKNSCTSASLEDISNTARSLGINIDEDNDTCKYGKNKANIIINDMKSKHITVIKKEGLPLQGDLWSEWSRLSKKQKRMDGISGNNKQTFISEMHTRKLKCRENQYKLVEKMSSLMRNFIQNLVDKKEGPECKIKFTQWMKIYLDGISRKQLPQLQEEFHSLCINMQVQTIERDSDSEKKRKKKYLAEVEKKLIATSLGLEHFFREVAQIYEAMISKKETAEHLKHLYLLPHFAASLLISGIPLEIMDGDASSMPLEWLKAVFSCLKDILGDKRVYVISVLGVQSSGKSTLLNTMFGLNFAVSAGRCTRGAYAQLIPVDDTLSIELGYEYILILDTEGLRAPELGETNGTHDNELATLIIGMGDVTILNIKGENVAEIEDILQISVHAFLRMRLVDKSLKLKPGCYFIHQNVAAVNASEKMLHGFQMIQKKLDTITVAAAEQEHASNILSFRDVIEFDVMKNVWYFTSLWQGDPPMAPANSSYSEKVLELKTSLLKYPSLKKIKCLTISGLTHRMSDLWKAILYESFVFSFRNGLEVQAFNDLELKYSSISWKFHSEVEIEVNGSLTEIDGCTEQSLDILNESLTISLDKCVNTNFSLYVKELNMFFEDKEIHVRWKCSTEKKLQNLRDEIKHDAKKTFDTHFAIRRAQLEGNKTDSYKDILKRSVKGLLELDEDIKESGSDESLKIMFNQEWNKCIESLQFESIPDKDPAVDILNILNEKFYQNSHLFDLELVKYDSVENSKYDIDTLPDIDDHDWRPKRWHRKQVKDQIKNLFYEIEASGDIVIFTRDLLREVKAYIKKKKHSDYESIFVHKIYNDISSKVATFNSGNQPFKLKINYIIKVTWHIFRNLSIQFRKMHNQYREKNDPKQYLEKHFKPELETYFFCMAKQYVQEKTAADILSTALENATLASVKRVLPIKIAESMKIVHPEFDTKLRLYAKVMEDLGSKPIFEYYINFLEDPNTSMENWLKYYVSEYCRKDASNGICNFINDANKELERILDNIVISVDKVNRSVAKGGISFNNWLKEFKIETRRIVSLQDTLFGMDDLNQIVDIGYFKKNVMQNLGSIREKLEKLFRTWNMEEFHDLDQQPHIYISRNILGCTKQCPFCKAVCILTHSEHDGEHRTTLHQPQAVGGTKWTHTKELELNTCNIDVNGSDHFLYGGEKFKYKEYRKANAYYASWDIPPETTFEASLYWKWVYVQFADKFAEHYNAVCPTIDSSWTDITWLEAKESLKGDDNLEPK